MMLLFGNAGCSDDHQTNLANTLNSIQSTDAASAAVCDLQELLLDLVQNLPETDR